MNINQKNKNNIQRKRKRTVSRISNNSNSINETINLEQARNENNIIKRDKISYPPQIGEIICKIVIDKIISISVRKFESNENSKKNENYYFNYISNQIENIIALNNIFYTEEPENFKVFDCSKYWNTCLQKANTWVEIKEPNSSKCDRYEGSYVKFNPLNKEDNLLNDLKPNSKNDSPLRENNNINKKEINKNKNKKKFKLKQSELESLEEIGSDSGDEEHVQLQEKNIKTNLLINKSVKASIKRKTIEANLIPNFSLEKVSPKKKRNEKVEFSSEDIPGIREEFNFEKYDPPEIEALRNGIVREKNEKNEHLDKNLLHLGKFLFNKNNNLSKEKRFDSEKLTFDSNGKIIKFKPLNVNILANDFKQMKHKLETFIPNKKKSLSKINFKKVNKKRSSSIKNNKDIIISKNPADDPDLHRGLFININQEKKNKLIQSGDNFALMSPNIGVIMKAQGKIKEGNRDFGKFFQKYSIEDYDKILKEYLPQENLELVKNKFKRIASALDVDKINQNNLLSLSNNNSKLYNNSFEFPNSIVNQDNLDNELNLSNINKAIINKNRINQLNNKLSSNFKTSTINDSTSFVSNKYNGSYMTVRNKKLNEFYPNGYIKIKNQSSSSLKLELDALKDLDFRNQILTPKNSRKKLENIFSNKYKNIFNKDKKENDTSQELNAFNKLIINDIGWGNNIIKRNMSNQNLLYSKHQSKYQIIKELGNNHITNFKLKLPRSRKTNILI